MVIVQQTVSVSGREVTVQRYHQAAEVHTFPSAEEAAGRAAIVREGLEWVGTPFINCADVKGRAGGVDCAMLMVRCYVDTGKLPAFDPRPYSATWMQSRGEEKFLEWVETKLGARRVEKPQLADLVIWMWGRCYSHGGLLINSREVVHAFGPADCCLISRMDEEPIKYVPYRSTNFLRPVRYYDVWSG
jgi:cell wall-associated NlpC family hydrolase